MLVPRGSPSHIAGNQVGPFLPCLFLLGTGKQGSDTGKSVLILCGPICCTLFWFSFTAAEGILRRVGEEHLLIAHTYFSTYIKITLLRGLRMF